MLVESNPDVMWGIPCFVGTRVPIRVVLSCIDTGNAWERIVASYPFLTTDHVKEAREYLKNAAR